MRVVHVLCSNVFSGAENVACNIIQLSKKDSRYSNIEFYYCGLECVKKYIESRKINFYALKKISAKYFKKMINDLKPDVIHAHDMKASFLSYLSTKKVPIISHIHNNSFDARKLTIKSFLFFVASRRIKHIFWVSKSSLKDYYFSKRVFKKSSILLNIVDEEDIKRKIQSDDRVFRTFDLIFLGRLCSDKNPEKLIKVIYLLSKIKSDIKVAIVGDGDLMDLTKEKANSYGLRDNIVFFGYQSNPYKIMQNSKILILVSKTEGMPMCALEAMVLHKPIVSTPVGGMIDLITEGYNGYLVDNEEEMARIINELLVDKDLYSYIQNNQKNESKKITDENYFISSIVEQYYLYEKKE